MYFHPNRIDKEKNKVELSLKLSDIDPENNPIKPRPQRKRKRKEESKAKRSNSYDSSLNSWLVKWCVFLFYRYSTVGHCLLHFIHLKNQLTKHTLVPYPHSLLLPYAFGALYLYIHNYRV